MILPMNLPALAEIDSLHWDSKLRNILSEVAATIALHGLTSSSSFFSLYDSKFGLEMPK